MPDVIVNTSPVQYLHQVGQLELFPRLYGAVWMPEAVAQELEEGRRRGVDLPSVSTLSWARSRAVDRGVLLKLATDLGPGESEVMALGLEMPGSLVILDDGLARRHATLLGLRLTGTLGVLLKGKQSGILSEVAPVLTELVARGFRLQQATKQVVLQLSGEA